MMSKTIRTGVSLAALMMAAGAAQAADLPRTYKAPAYVAPSFANWTGFYAGLNAGYGFGKSDWDVPAVSPEPKGFVGGVTLGYNFQTGMWLWGIEGDAAYSDMKGDETCGAGTCETKNTWLGTARARLGYAGWNNWLPYVTGGAAVADTMAARAGGASANKTKVGWTAGAGVEYAMWSNWSVKLEYLYVDLGSFDCGISCGAAVDNVSFKANVVRAGLNYRF